MSCGLFSGSALLAGRLPAGYRAYPKDSITKMNQGDGQKSATTAGSAMNNKSDREIMQQIRKSVIEDKSLSTYGHNVKIIARHGQVTLEGRCAFRTMKEATSKPRPEKLPAIAERRQPANGQGRSRPVKARLEETLI